MLNYSLFFFKFIASLGRLFAVFINNYIKIDPLYLLFNADVMALFNLFSLLLLNILIARCLLTIFYFFKIFDSISLSTGRLREIVCKRLLFNSLLKRRRLLLINIYYKEKETLAIPVSQKIYFAISIIEGGNNYIFYGCATSG